LNMGGRALARSFDRNVARTKRKKTVLGFGTFLQKDDGKHEDAVQTC